jgi:hypothetical protein
MPISLFSCGQCVALSASCLASDLAEAQTTFERTYGRSGFECGAGSVEQTSDGGYIVSGWIEAKGGEANAYLIRTNAHGDTLWTRTFSGGVEAVQQTSDGGYIVAGYTDAHSANGYKVNLIKTQVDCCPIFPHRMWLRWLRRHCSDYDANSLC